MAISSSRDAQIQSAQASFYTSVSGAQATLASIQKNISENESRLTSDGFTTSDKKLSDGSWKYPRCNSQKNDQPEQNWATFLSQIKSGIPSTLTRLQGSTGCQMASLESDGLFDAGSAQDMTTL